MERKGIYHTLTPLPITAPLTSDSDPAVSSGGLGPSDPARLQYWL